MQFRLKTLSRRCWPLHAVLYHHTTATADSVPTAAWISKQKGIEPVKMIFFSLTPIWSWLPPHLWHHSLQAQICRCNSCRALSIAINFLPQVSKPPVDFWATRLNANTKQNKTNKKKKGKKKRTQTIVHVTSQMLQLALPPLLLSRIP